MPHDWFRIEVEATGSAHFEMLDLELRGMPYNTTESRRRLMRLLDGRSDGAVERKHRNISAMLIELGFPYIPGCEPLRNYQQLLFDVVVEQMEASAEIVATVGEAVVVNIEAARVAQAW